MSVSILSVLVVYMIKYYVCYFSNFSGNKTSPDTSKLLYRFYQIHYNKNIARTN